MSEKLTKSEISYLLSAENPKMDARVGELIRDLYGRVTELEDQVAELSK